MKEEKKIKTYIIQVDNSPFRVSVDQRAHQMGAAVGAEKFETVHLRPTGQRLHQPTHACAVYVKKTT